MLFSIKESKATFGDTLSDSSRVQSDFSATTTTKPAAQIIWKGQ